MKRKVKTKVKGFRTTDGAGVISKSFGESDNKRV